MSSKQRKDKKSPIQELIDGFKEGFRPGARYFALALLLGGSLMVPAVHAETEHQHSYQIAANQTDINNDGKDDLKQMGQGLNNLGKKIDPQAANLGHVLSQKTNEAGDKLIEGSKKLGAKAEEGFNKVDTSVNNTLNRANFDLNDKTSPVPFSWTWLVIGLIALAIVGLLFAASRRRPVSTYR